MGCLKTLPHCWMQTYLHMDKFLCTVTPLLQGVIIITVECLQTELQLREVEDIAASDAFVSPECMFRLRELCPTRKKSANFHLV